MSIQQKIYILDTNVLIHDPQSIFSFSKALIGIPTMVLEELDKFKSETTDRGRNAREATRQLDALRQKGSLKDGVLLDNGGTLKIFFFENGISQNFPFLLKSEDNQILLTALSLMKKGYDVTFISKDINARVKADVLGLKTEDYLKGRVAEYDIYKGWTKAIAPSVQLKKEIPDVLNELLTERGLEINEFVLVESNNNPFNYKIFRYLGSGKFKRVEVPDFRWPIEPKNAQQLMTLDLLLDKDIQLVSLIGPAGTGKTFLALLAGLQQVMIEEEYDRILISRPVIPLGPDIGYLPGDIQEKLHSWMQPVYDNLELIVHSSVSRSNLQEMREEETRRRKKRPKWERDREKRELRPLQDMINSGKISLEAITYMRGRSIPFQYIFIDEVQNLTPHEVKTLITRVGQGSKIILSGDPYQIDSPYLDFSSNGLVVASNRFKGKSLFGAVFLEISERSEISRLAGELL
jgi:PhoH-like ATPase